VPGPRFRLVHVLSSGSRQKNSGVPLRKHVIAPICKVQIVPPTLRGSAARPNTLRRSRNMLPPLTVLSTFALIRFLKHSITRSSVNHINLMKWPATLRQINPQRPAVGPRVVRPGQAKRQRTSGEPWGKIAKFSSRIDIARTSTQLPLPTLVVMERSVIPPPPSASAPANGVLTTHDIVSS
jgi:hypothetical protein